MANVPLFYSAVHQQHAPKVEYYHGNLLEYAEKPPRIEIMRDHLVKAGMVEVIEITEQMSAAVLLKTLDPEMVALVKLTPEIIASGRLFQQGNLYQLGEGEPYIYPSFSPIRPFMNRLKDSVVAGMGHFFTDREAPLGKGTWNAAIMSATLAYEGAKLLLEGKSNLAYALCRPPGHHAGRDFMGGYCYFNNAAIAAIELMNMGKVAIIDIDYHHGNGTQAIFWDEPNVLFASTHADPSFEYPYYSGYADETGGEAAPNLNLNYPLPSGTTADQFYGTVQDLLAKVAAYQPASIVLSMGYDTFEDDPLSTFKVKRETYQQIGKAIQQLGLPVLVVQEGGYQVGVLGELAEQLLIGLSA